MSERNDIIEECVQEAWRYRDERQTIFKGMSGPNWTKPDGTYAIGDPDRIMGQIWAAEQIGRLLRKMKKAEKSNRDDLQQCEHCLKSFDIEKCHMMEDVWICDGCYQEWKAEFDKCEHEWETYTNVMGEDSRHASEARWRSRAGGAGQR